MGLFDFVKAAGRAIGIGGAEAAVAPAAADVQKEVESYDLGVEDLKVEVEGDTVKIAGKAASQEAREKAIIAAGNIAGVAKVEDSIEAADAADPVFHTVEKGDTLWAISAKHLGNGAKYMEIFEANKPMLSDPDKIYPGQVLRIPSA